MVLVNQSFNRYSELRSQRNFSGILPSRLIQRSFSSKTQFRQYPLLATFHRTTDGALVGLLLTVVVMSTIALHSQHLWNVSFSSLETSRDLIQQLRESTSILERHFLTSKSLSKFMVEPAHPEEDLIYLDKPIEGSHSINYDNDEFNIISKLIFFPVSYGY